VLFGQRKERKRDLSPKGGPIRTEEGGKKKFESEWRCYSDNRKAGKEI
jgi:hypothetical protein